ncbi:MAG: hypothetical protein RLZZ221_696, partial [Verrucomicrobiota bacterium]
DIYRNETGSVAHYTLPCTDPLQRADLPFIFPARRELIATLKAEIGELSRVKRIVRVGGFVNAVDDFKEQPQVMNGCSDLLVAVFGERGKHARAALGVASLPLGAVVEIEMVVEVE